MTRTLRPPRPSVYRCLAALRLRMEPLSIEAQQLVRWAYIQPQCFQPGDVPRLRGAWADYLRRELTDH